MSIRVGAFLNTSQSKGIPEQIGNWVSGLWGNASQGRGGEKILCCSLSTYTAFKILNIFTPMRKISAWQLARVLRSESQYPLASVAAGYLRGFFLSFKSIRTYIGSKKDL